MARNEQLHIAGKTLVALGPLVLFSEPEQLRKLVEGYGGRLEDSVTAATDYLICNEKAAEYDLPVITEAELLAMLWSGDPLPEKKPFTGTLQGGMGTFQVKEGVLVQYTGKASFVLLPPEVTGIGEKAFCKCESLRSIVIPEGVRSIGKRAFYQLDRLEEVTISSTVQRIGERAFCDCRELTRLTLAEGVKRIGKEAFANCVGLRQLQIPGSAQLGEEAFACCIHLEQLQVQPGVTEIGRRCFRSCQELRQLVLPEGLLHIREGAFGYCCDLQRVVLPESLRTIGSMAFAACHCLEELRIPGSVEVISENAFSYCDLEKLSLSEGLREIREMAFSNCSFRSITLPQSLQVLRENAFYNCWELETVEGPEQIPDASVCAFFGCRKLADPRGLLIVDTTLVTAFLRGVQHLVIPDGVTDIVDLALQETEDLESVVVPDSVKSLGAEFLSGGYDDEPAYENLRSVTLPTHITQLMRNVLRPDGPMEYLFAPGLPVEQLRERRLMLAATVGYLCHPEAYADNPDLEAYKSYASRHKKQIIPMLLKGDRVEGLSTYASIGKIDPDHFETLFMQPALEAKANECVAFLVDWKNKNIDPEYEEKRLLRELNRDVFHAQDMKKLWKYAAMENGCCLVGYLGEEPEVVVPPRIGRKPVLQLAPLAMSPDNVIIRHTRRLPGERITTVTFLDGVPLIGERAFRECLALKRVSFAPGTKILGDQAFSRCFGLQQVELAEGLLEIGEETFENCQKLQRLDIPDTVTRIGVGAFRWCKELRSVTLPSQLRELPRDVFSACHKLEELCIPKGVEVIGETAFRWCYTLKKVRLPEGLRSIQRAAFYACRRLQELEIPEGVTTIGSECFAECYQMKKLRLPSSLQRLGADVFRDCTCLTIYGPAGSYAEQYAKRKNIPFVAE